MTAKNYLILIFLLGTFFCAFGQTGTSFLSHADSALQKYNFGHDDEKVYLHLNKSSCFPGDTIWYKAYVVSASDHRLSGISGVLYTELISPKDSVLQRQVLRLTAGIAWSQFSLPRSLATGRYRVRAYTNWMRNWPEYFYDQPITVGIIPVIASNSNPVSVHPDVQFFPEGGELVNGLRSRVAFKAAGVDGLGVNISGTITDNNGNVVADIGTQHLGMGVFALRPEAGKSYYAKINTPGEEVFTVPLPAAKDSGFTLSIDNRARDSVYVKIAANDKLFANAENAGFCLTAQSGGKLYYTTAGKLAAPVFIAAIDKSRFPSGITRFTLFSAKGEPLNERIAFIQNDDTVGMQETGLQATYAPRQKVSVGLETYPGEKIKPLSSLSVSVINISRVPVNENAESTILNNLLLTSDLKGYIEQPNYYFTNTDDQKRADLDLLMLTQGYRRFEWQQVLSNDRAPLAYQPESDLSLEGTLKTPSGKPVPNGKITLMATRNGFLADTVTDANGNFRFTGADLPDTAKIILRARKAHNGSNVSIYVKQQDIPPVLKGRTPRATANIDFSPEMQAGITQYREQVKQDSIAKAKQLKEVVIKAKPEAKPDAYNGYGTKEEHFLDMKKLQIYPSMDIALQDQPMITNDIPAFRTDNRSYKEKLGSIPVIVDGIPDQSGDLYAIRPDEVQSVRLIYPIDNAKGGPSLIVITTKHFAGTDTTMLKEVVVKAKKISKFSLSSSSNLHGGGNADQVIMGDDLSGCVNLSDCLVTKIHGVTFDYNGRPISSRGLESGSMSVIVDGIILDGSALNDINKNDIYSIEVMRSVAARSIYGSSIEKGGALIITTRRSADPNYATSIVPAGLITYPFKGFHAARVFYSPKYDHPKTPDQPFDPRTAVYWNPNIITDKDGKASFEFYNADSKGIYRIVIEGIDDNGHIGRAEYQYKVE